MHTGVYGSGYLATVIASCIADFGLPVTCFDDNSARLNAIAHAEVPYFEKNLKDIVKRNVRTGRLNFTTEIEPLTKRAKIFILAQDSAQYIDDIALRVGQLCTPDHILVIATPVAVGTARRIETKLRANGSQAVVVSHPIFLTDGCAVEDFNWPDRIVLGTESNSSVMAIKQLYRPLVMRGVPVIVTNFETAELVREASTAFLATKISFINEISGLCEHVNADAVDLALALGLDKKIAPRCLQPGAGFGGSFSQSDMDALAELAYSNNVPLKVLTAAREVNTSFCDQILSKITNALSSIMGKGVGLLGLAFKPNTNSVASSASILLAKQLLANGAHVKAYDPVAIREAQLELSDSPVHFCNSAYAAAEGSDALVISTGWPEFRALDFDKIRRTLKRPVIVDTKNLLDGARLRSMGFEYVGVGRVN